MRYLQARKLHNEDEVAFGKRRGRQAVYHGKIIAVHDYPNEKCCTFDIMGDDGRYLDAIPHTMIF